jgi:hypothetical protein
MRRGIFFTVDFAFAIAYPPRARFWHQRSRATELPAWRRRALPNGAPTGMDQSINWCLSVPDGQWADVETALPGEFRRRTGFAGAHPNLPDFGTATGAVALGSGPWSGYSARAG